MPPDERTALGDAQRRRAYVYEYAAKIGVELGPATTWRQNRALLRSVVNRMRRDFQQRYETERQLDEVEHLRGELREQIQKLRASGLLDDLTRFDTTAQRCAMEIARDLVAAAPSRPPDSPPVSPPAAPPGRGYAVFVLTNASDGLYIGTEASLRGRPRCDFDGGGVGCRASDTITSRLLLGPYPTFDEARAAFCANITERHYFPLGVGLKGRWRGVEWYGLWHDSVSGPCLGATTATPPPAALPPPISGWGVFQLTNASDGLYLGTEDALRRRTRCSFGGGGINCSPRDVVAYRMLLGPFPTQSEARAALCRSVTERRVFPLGIGLKGRWQGGNTWYGLWDESVTADCGR